MGCASTVERTLPHCLGVALKIGDFFQTILDVPRCVGADTVGPWTTPTWEKAATTPVYCIHLGVHIGMRMWFNFFPLLTTVSGVHS